LKSFQRERPAMRTLFTLMLGHFQVAGGNARYPNRLELIQLFKELPYATVDSANLGQTELVEYYKNQSKPIFDAIFDPTRNAELVKDLEYVVFYGEIATGARIVVTNRNSGQIKVRIWDPKLDHLLSGVEEFFEQLQIVERSARRSIGDGVLFPSKEIDLQVLEKAEIDEVLKGTTVRVSRTQQFWHESKNKAYVFIAAVTVVALIFALTLLMDVSSEQNKKLVENLRLLIPAAVAIAGNYLVQMFITFPRSRAVVTWKLARNRAYSSDI
jgi:hypothetical protein